MRRFRLALAVATTALSLTAATQASAAGTAISDNYTRTSGGETIVAPFTAANGIASISTFSNFVEILVSGTGFSAGSNVNDAFYGPNASINDPYYQLGIGTNTGTQFAPFQPGLAAVNRIVFIEGMGAVANGTRPNYNGSNTYRFVINAGASATPLTFGVLDGNYTDNGGQYRITAYQLVAGVVSGAVPEPATWAMMLTGFGLVGAGMRRRRSSTNTKVSVRYAAA